MKENFINVEQATISTTKLALCIFFFVCLLAVPLFLLVSIMRHSEPYQLMSVLPTISVFKYWGKAFNEESMGTYLALGYGLMISVASAASLFF
jgi:hypothetical protein